MVIQLGSILHGTCIVLRAISKASVSSLKTSVDAELVILYASFAYKAIFLIQCVSFTPPLRRFLNDEQIMCRRGPSLALLERTCAPRST